MFRLLTLTDTASELNEVKRKMEQNPETRSRRGLTEECVCEHMEGLTKKDGENGEKARLRRTSTASKTKEVESWSSWSGLKKKKKQLGSDTAYL